MLPIGNLMRDSEINLPFMLYREDDGVVLGYVRTEQIAREISQSSGVIGVPPVVPVPTPE